MDKTKTKNIKQVSAKIFYLAVAMSELGAVIMLSLVKGETAGTIARVIAVPLAMDFFIRVATITKPFFKNTEL
jgi:hypothetical protein